VILSLDEFLGIASQVAKQNISIIGKTFGYARLQLWVEVLRFNKKIIKTMCLSCITDKTDYIDALMHC
jgi:hypothetical protein